MDDLKQYESSDRKLDLFVQTMAIFSDDVSMVFCLDKCAVLVLKRWKIVQTKGIQLPDEMLMGEVNLDKYKYLGVLQLEPIMNRKKMKSEYTWRVKKLLRSKLNGGNVIAGINAWTVGIIRYGAGVLDWTKEELKTIDIKTRKSMTINGSLHWRGNVGRFYFKDFRF